MLHRRAAAALVALGFSFALVAPAFAAAPQPAATAATQPAKPAQHRALSRHAVEQVQGALQRAGEQVATDGIWGPKTAAALKDFQQKHGLAATGHLDRATRQQLRAMHS